MKKIYLILCLALGFASLTASNNNISNRDFHSSNAFLENKGQVKDFEGNPRPDVKFVYSGKGFKIFFTQSGLSYQFSKTTYPEGYRKMLVQKYDVDFYTLEELRKKVITETYRIELQLVGANPSPIVSAEGKSEDYIHFYNHNALNVHHFQKITYQEVYPGIDWVVYQSEAGLKYDFVVQPGVDPSVIKMKYNHHENLDLNSDGSLDIKCQLGKITEKAPVSFQGNNPVETQFKLNGDEVSFSLAKYNPKKILLIDPPLFWATYYGGENDDAGFDLAIDSSGNTYMVGVTGSLTAMSSTGGHQIVHGGAIIDGFIAKFDRQGQRVWATYFGGTDSDAIYGCAIDADQNLVVAGFTFSTNNISTPNSFQPTKPFGRNGFIAKFSSSGNLIWGTYYGGQGNDAIYHCAVDRLGNILVAGTTGSTNALASSNAHQTSNGGGLSDAFLAKFNTNGMRLWGTFYGGPQENGGYSCSVDSIGNCYLIGHTRNDSVMVTPGTHLDSLPFPTSTSTFVAKFDSFGNREWGTFIGSGALGHQGTADPQGNIYVAGYANNWADKVFITPGAYQQNALGGLDAYLVKLDTAGTLQWGTFFGGNSTDVAETVALDSDGNVLLGGKTRSTSGISTNSYRQPNFGGGSYDGFIAKFSPNGDRYWGTYYGHDREDILISIKAHNDGRILATGHTLSDTGMATAGAYQTALNDESDAFLAVFQSCFIDNNAFDSLGTFYASLDTSAAQHQWILCSTNTPIPGATNRTFTPTNNGLYKVAITDGGCNDTSNCLSTCVLDVTTKWNPSTLTVNHQPGPGVVYQWLDCDSGFAPIAGANGQGFSPTRSGNYAVAIDDNGCKDTSDCRGFSFMSLPEDVLSQTSLYPNPTRGEIQILLNENIALGQNQVKVEVYNILGQKTFSQSITSNPQTIDLSGQPSGVYLVKIFHVQSGEIYTERVVKKD